MTTPLMQQYWDLKDQAKDCLLLFRMGDFYELFGEDAVTASRILEITLTSRDKNSEKPVAMAGVPHHAVQSYLQKLLRSGFKVAIGEQVEDPAEAKAAGRSIVKREITRIFSPALHFENESQECFLAGVWEEKRQYYLALLEPGTGRVRVSEGLELDLLQRQIQSFNVQHLLNFTDIALDFSGLTEKLPRQWLSPDQALSTLKNQYGASRFEAFFQQAPQRHLVASLISYTLKSQKVTALPHIQPPRPLMEPDTLVYGPETPRHLDLYPGPEKKPNLFDLISRHCRTSMGQRQVRDWLSHPLQKLEHIKERQDAIREISRLISPGNDAARLMSEVYDLERILGRVHTRLANPRDTLALGRSLAVMDRVMALLAPLSAALSEKIRQQLYQALKTAQPLTRKIVSAQESEAPLVSREGKIFKKGFDPELDRLIDLTEKGEDWLLELENRERQATGISSLKVRYNRVFGYYIEITKTHLKSVPDHYQRKQSMVNAERFFTEELKKFEEEILSAESKRKTLEQELFHQLLEELVQMSAAISQVARGVGKLDALLSLAALAEKTAWCFPSIDDSLEMNIVQGRHPLVDEAMGGAFVPNDCRLHPEDRNTLLITGPNMGGKSTVMRQNALIVILGQMGAPVPAQSAQWGSFDSIYTRIGAHDSIATGQSTFMVEMSELAHILTYARRRSLIILDEIGRGTSTYDGISVAWATLEWICKVIGARTLFATHYHELTQLSDQLPTLCNMHMGVQGERALEKGELRFEYRLREGATNDSFGVQVARLAGIPQAVVKRAWEILKQLEQQAEGAAEVNISLENPDQLSLFGAAAASPVTTGPLESVPPSNNKEKRQLEDLLHTLNSIKVEDMTPLQALNKLAEVKDSVRPYGSF